MLQDLVDLKAGLQEQQQERLEEQNGKKKQDYEGMTKEQKKLAKKIVSMQKGMIKSEMRFNAVHDEIKKHTQLEESKQQL